MQLNPEQFTSAQKANLGIVMGLTTRAFEGIEQLATLNLQVIKTGIEEAGEAGFDGHAFCGGIELSFLALQAGALQPGADKAASYCRQVYDIFLSTKAEVEKVAAEQATGIQQSMFTAFEAATRNVPESSSTGVAFFKSAFAGATNAFDNMQKAARQAIDVAEANYTAVTESATKGSGRTKRGN